ncbi:cytosolic phospholipase A2 gamma-like [Lepisosteus oculatus]|uniref:cytosolic phospholipase A2 gamma-like n=1 Tax=Lepisosteus oculatus TaxID=7918 RepID=UPI0035F52E2F
MNPHKPKRRRTEETEKASYIRVAHTLCEGENKDIQKRKIKIQNALRSLQIPCDADCVPPIAVLGSGGGLRAMVALIGTLTELGAQNLLDTIMYLCGVSGSTWCMSSLYRDPQWSSQVEDAETKMVETLNNGKFSFINSWQRITKSIEDENFSCTDIWEATFVYMVVKEMDDRKLSKEEDAEMTNPYPIYAAVNKSQLDDKEKYNKGTWFEITRHEAGYPEYGAFVDTSALGSQFRGGNKIKHKDEMSMLSLQGLFGSAIGDMRENEKFILGRPPSEDVFSFYNDVEEDEEDLSLGDEYEKTAIFWLLDLHQNFLWGKDCKHILKSMNNIVKDEKVIYELVSLMYDTWDIVGKDIQQRMISALSEAVFYHFEENSLPSKLVSEDKIYLIDAGLSINSAYPLVLRRDRGVQLILSFDFSDGDPFMTVTEAAQYCDKNKIPFPTIPAMSEEEKKCPSSVYIFKGENTPTVMHFPLFNKDNCGGEEKIEAMRKTYGTIRMSYSENELQNLLKAAKKNVEINRNKIVAEIQNAMDAERKKKHQ